MNGWIWPGAGARWPVTIGCMRWNLPSGVVVLFAAVADTVIGLSTSSRRHVRARRKLRSAAADGEATLRFFVLLPLTSACRLASAETVQVKYHGPVSPDSCACADVIEGSDVSRICHDAAER